MTALPREEAEKRSALVSVVQMSVRVDLSQTALSLRDRFASETSIEFDCLVDGASTFIDFRGDDLTGVQLNETAAIDPDWRDGRVYLTGLQAGRSVVRITGVMRYSTDGEGLHRHVDAADGRAYVYAMSFLDAAPRWFACFDQPDMKAPYRLEVTVPPDWQVWGNGAAREMRAADTFGEPAVRRTWVIEQPCPLATYFVTLVAGPWVSLTRHHHATQLTLVTRQSLIDELTREADDIFTVTTAAFDAYHRWFDAPYPFGQYTQAFVPDFNAGAMENPACITLRDQMLFRGRPTALERCRRATTIAHEMAHQWFGDLVTMRWWDDLWLSESFAEYMGCRVVTESTRYDAWTQYLIGRADWGSVADQGPTTHPVAGNGALDTRAALASFDGISYAKGAALLRQLATSLGDEVFFRGLNRYFAAHQFGNASLADLLAALTTAGATELEAFNAEWLVTAGLDTVAVVDNNLIVTPGRAGLTSGPVSGLALDVAALDDTGAEVSRVTLRDVLPGRRALPDCANHALVQVPDAEGTCWVRRRPSTWRLPPLARIESTNTRVVLHNAMRDAVRAGDLSVADALDLIVAGLPGEPDDQIVAPIIGFAVDLAGRWSPWAARRSRLALVADLIDDLIVDADRASDRHLVLTRALVSCTTDTDWLLGWLTGPVDDGEHADHDLRWAVVTRLMALGGSDALVADELARDPLGVDKAAGARAAAPRVDAKQAALDALLLPFDKRAYELYAIAQNIWQVGQEELCAPFVERWFLGIGATASFRDGWALGRIARESFPLSVASDDSWVIARTTRDGTTDQRLRSELAEGTDMLERILRARRA